MTPERWARIAELFGQASLLAPADRPRFLEAAAGDDIALRSEIEALLEVGDAGHVALQSLIGDGAALAGAALASPALEGRRLGAYRLLRELGQGGMGVVYLATRDDAEYLTEVAIKVLRRGLESAAAIARFRDERQILATLEHPGIVRMLDGGSTDEGLPYLVMELVDGVPIDVYADTHRLSVRERVVLFRQVCDALEYAHSRLIVHRDLKPRNILVNARGQPKLLDFGIARLLDEAGGTREAHTGTGAQLLTPGYASPEQVRGEPVSTSADVYALGAVLYELMSGARPHAGADGLEALRAMLEVEPSRPSAGAPAERRRPLEGDLDNIILMALRKDAARRYRSVAQLSDDLGRHLAGLPVVARPPTFRYRAGKFVRRHKGALALAALVAAALATATVVSLGLAARAEHEARRAERRFADVRRLANSLLFEVDDSIRDAPGTTAARELIVRRAREYLDDLAQDAGDDEGLARELALAYMKIGDIQGNALDPNLGRPDDGLASYARARAILEPLARRDDPDGATRAAWARLDYGTALLHWSNGDHEPAIASVHSALRTVDAAPAELGLDGRTIARGYFVLATTHGGNDGATAVATADRLAGFVEGWAAREPSPETRYWTSIAHSLRAENALDLDGDPDEALRRLTRSRDLLRTLTVEVPTSSAYRRELFSNAFRVGALQAGGPDHGLWSPTAGAASAAEADYREALALAAEAAATDRKNVRAQSESAVARAGVGWVLQQRDAAAGLLVLEPALVELAALPEEMRQGYMARSEWFTRCVTAATRARLGQRERALTDIQGAQAFVARYFDKGGMEELQCRFLEAEVRAALGEPALAAEIFATIDTALTAKLAEDPKDVRLAIGLTSTLARLAELRPEASCAFLARALTLWDAPRGAATAFVARQRQRLTDTAARAACRR